jgi:hypothetical protein
MAVKKNGNVGNTIARDLQAYRGGTTRPKNITGTATQESVRTSPTTVMSRLKKTQPVAVKEQLKKKIDRTKTVNAPKSQVMKR